jgi:ComF family protein
MNHTGSVGSLKMIYRFKSLNSHAGVDCIGSAMANWAKAVLKVILDAVFPPKCLVCRRLFKPADAPGSVHPANTAFTIMDTFSEFYELLSTSCCPDCLKGFMSIASPICECCGMMFKGHADDDHLCGECLAQPKKFRMARAAMVYDHQLMAVIHRFKYAGKTKLARPLGWLILGAYLQHWHAEKIDLILPVPLHSKKMRRRGFNQSYLLVNSWNSISKALVDELNKIPIKTDVLVRNKATLPQTGLGRQQRLKNIKGAFKVRIPEKVYGKKVLLVDDVYTTGATVNECARMLLKAGAQMVDVLTVARAL